MRIFLSFLFSALFSSAFGQGEFESEDYPIAIKFPENWTINEYDDDPELVVSLIYKLDVDGKLRLAASFAIIAKPAQFGDDLEDMAMSYRKELYSRTDMDKEKILTEEIIDFNGVKAIDITGQATIPVVKQAAKWRIILFEYGDHYYEISATSTKKDSKNKTIKADVESIFSSVELK